MKLTNTDITILLIVTSILILVIINLIVVMKREHHEARRSEERTEEPVATIKGDWSAFTETLIQTGVAAEDLARRLRERELYKKWR